MNFFRQVKVLEKSFETVLACRKTLMISYVFAYFVTEGNQKTIFEQNRRDLEVAVDILSGYLQSDETYQQFAESNIKIRDKTEYVMHRIGIISMFIHSIRLLLLSDIVIIAE